MVLSDERFQVTIEKDTQYSLFSTDNRKYDHTYFLEEYSRNDFFSAYSISIISKTECALIVVVGRAFGCIENCAVLENDRLVVLVDNYLAFINLINYQLMDKIKIIDFGTGIEIHSFDNGYVVNSELDIIKINKHGIKEWSFSGRDIWVTPNGERSLIITSDKLCLTDWYGNKYLVNKDGDEIPVQNA